MLMNFMSTNCLVRLSIIRIRKKIKMKKDITGKKEGNVLFNNALSTFNLWLYSVRHMVKDHSDS